MAAIDLKTQARRAGFKKKRLELTAIETTKSQEKELARMYLRVVSIWSKQARERIIPAYAQALKEQKERDKLMRDDANNVNLEVEQTESFAVRAIASFREAFQFWASGVQEWHFKKFVSQIKYKSNVDLETQMSAGDVQMTMEDILNRNVALVRNVSDQTRGRIADIVFRGLQNRTPIREVAREIAKATNLGRARALRIASDQTVKLSAALDEERQRQVGMDEFEWLHSGKEHFRPWHKARNGKIFSWSGEVAKTDPPGFAPFCGCKSKGVLNFDDN